MCTPLPDKLSTEDRSFLGSIHFSVPSVPSVCVCLSVSGLTTEPFPKFGGGVDLDNISGELKGQGKPDQMG